MWRRKVGISISINTDFLEGNWVLTMERPEGFSPHIGKWQVRFLSKCGSSQGFESKFSMFCSNTLKDFIQSLRTECSLKLEQHFPLGFRNISCQKWYTYFPQLWNPWTVIYMIKKSWQIIRMLCCKFGCFVGASTAGAACSGREQRNRAGSSSKSSVFPLLRQHVWHNWQLISPASDVSCLWMPPLC